MGHFCIFLILEISHIENDFSEMLAAGAKKFVRRIRIFPIYNVKDVRAQSSLLEELSNVIPKGIDEVPLFLWSPCA